MTDHRYDIAVDYMDMTNDGRLWVRPVDVRAGVSINVGRYAVVRDDDADPSVMADGSCWLRSSGPGSRTG